MKTFNITAIIGDTEHTFNIHEESMAKSYIVREDQRFLTRIFKETDGSWKSLEVSDLSPGDINTIGEEINIYLSNQQGESK